MIGRLEKKSLSLETDVLCAIEKGWGEWGERNEAMLSAGNNHRKIVAGRRASADKPVPYGFYGLLIVLC